MASGFLPVLTLLSLRAKWPRACRKDGFTRTVVVQRSLNAPAAGQVHIERFEHEALGRPR
jgi:hypothetical protein